MTDGDNQSLISIGFLIGYLRKAIVSNAITDEDEGLWLLLERIDELAIKGRLHERQPAEEACRMLILSIGELKGRVYHVPIAHAVSEAIDHLCLRYGDHRILGEESAEGMKPCETESERLSDYQRDQLTGTTLNNFEEDTTSAEFATKIGASIEGTVSYWQTLGALEQDEASQILADAASQEVESLGEHEEMEVAAPRVIIATSVFHPFNPSGKRGRREWTPEQRAAQAERMKNKPPLVPDSALEAVKTEFEAGAPFDRIGSKFGCSGGHIRNFLTKHGIDPRRGRPGAKTAEQPPLTDEPQHASLPDSGDEEAAEPAQADTSPAARWKPSLPGPDDWLDIQKMLADGRTREAIAGDYDVPMADLNTFIAERLEEGKQRRAMLVTKEAKPAVGEALAPLH